VEGERVATTGEAKPSALEERRLTCAGYVAIGLVSEAVFAVVVVAAAVIALKTIPVALLSASFCPNLCVNTIPTLDVANFVECTYLQGFWCC